MVAALGNPLAAHLSLLYDDVIGGPQHPSVLWSCLLVHYKSVVDVYEVEITHIALLC